MIICSLALLVSFVTFAHAAALSFPPLSGRVVDEAGILSADTQDKLTQLLAQEEKQTTNQIVVVTLKSLQGQTIEDYGYQLGRHWGIGQKGTNNGTLIIVAPNEHATRIEAGYGMEGQLTDAQDRIIIERYMLPAFRRGDYDGGVIAGTDAVLQVLGGVALSPPQDANDDQDQRHGGGGLPWGFIVIVLVWLVFGRVLWPLLFLGGLGGFGGRRFGGGFGGGGFGGGGFGGGGFSGGGGSFGGGGASGHW